MTAPLVYCLCCYPCLSCAGQRENEDDRYCGKCRASKKEGNR